MNPSVIIFFAGSGECNEILMYAMEQPLTRVGVGQQLIRLEGGAHPRPSRGTKKSVTEASPHCLTFYDSSAVKRIC